MANQVQRLRPRVELWYVSPEPTGRCTIQGPTPSTHAATRASDDILADRKHRFRSIRDNMSNSFHSVLYEKYAARGEKRQISETTDKGVGSQIEELLKIPSDQVALVPKMVYVP